MKNKKESALVRPCKNMLWVFTGLVCSTVLPAAEDHSQHHAPSSLSSGPSSSGQSGGANTATLYPLPTAEQLQAAFPDLGGMSMADHMGGQYYGMVLIDRLEVQDTARHATQVWDARVSWGRDFDKINISSEGERSAGATEHMRTELFWSHALTPWWDGTLGLRQDSGEGADRRWAAFGVQGMAPYFFEVSATAYAGESGRSALRLEAEYDMRISNRLILQPRVEVNAYGKADAENGIGKGLSESELGLRLRYEIRREFAPYMGVEWSRKHAGTADMVRVAGERSAEASVVAGVRVWF